MRIFTASWFFPPATSAEGLVTYKLLKHSAYTYDVCCSRSKLWGHAKESDLKAENIHVYPVDTDQIDVWVKACIRLFRKLDRTCHYDCVMTRSMPPESILAGLAIKKIRPGIRWIASMADPVFRNPYELETYIYEDVLLKKLHVNQFLIRHPKAIRHLPVFLPANKYKLLRNLYELEQEALRHADLIVLPSEKQKDYLMEMKQNRRYKNKCQVVPHSFDSSLYPKRKERSKERVCITYVGYLDRKRMPTEFLQALAHLKKIHPSAAKKLLVQFVGNIDSAVKDAANAFFLDDIVKIQEPVSYLESLKWMKEADYLLHIDAWFSFLKEGSIFCASKLIDYLGSQNQVLALTDQSSEAARIVTESGGVLLERGNVLQISETLKELVDDGSAAHQSMAEEAAKNKRLLKYSSAQTARYFDRLLKERLKG